jgi:hypothetical protein
MRDEKQWHLANSQFRALRKTIPNLIDTGLVAEYHAILRLLTDSSGEDFSSFQIPDSELKPRVTGWQVGSSRRPGSTFYSKENFCEYDLFERKIEALSHYLQAIERSPAAGTLPEGSKDYWSMSDVSLENLAIKYNIGGYADQTMHIDRDIIIEKLLQRDRALKPERPSTPTNAIHVQSMTGSVIQQGTSHSNATVDFSISEAKRIVDLIKEAMNSLPLGDDAKADLQSDIQTIEPQLSAARPKLPIIKECMRSMLAILETTAHHAAAIILIHEISHYLSILSN